MSDESGADAARKSHAALERWHQVEARLSTVERQQERLAEAGRDLDGRLRGLYREPDGARIAIDSSLDARGLADTRELLRSQPEQFGTLLDGAAAASTFGQWHSETACAQVLSGLASYAEARESLHQSVSWVCSMGRSSAADAEQRAEDLRLFTEQPTLLDRMVNPPQQERVVELDPYGQERELANINDESVRWMTANEHDEPPGFDR